MNHLSVKTIVTFQALGRGGSYLYLRPRPLIFHGGGGGSLFQFSAVGEEEEAAGKKKLAQGQPPSARSTQECDSDVLFFLI